jgi:hypothetical protein
MLTCHNFDKNIAKMFQIFTKEVFCLEFNETRRNLEILNSNTTTKKLLEERFPKPYYLNH